MALIINLLQYLDGAAAANPDKTAFSDGTLSVTFSELNNMSRACGTFLAENIGAVNRPVAVFTDRTAITIAGFLAALQSGNFYVPIDNGMPVARITEILKQISPAAVLTAKKDAELARSFGYNTVVIEDAVRSPADGVLLAACRERVLDIDPAYVIFTSGSTGTPKGIVVSHRSVIDFIEWMAETCGINADCVMGNQAPFYFDLSVKDVWLTIRCGATAHILQPKLFMFPKLLVQELNDKKITNLNWATSAFNLVANSGIFKKYVPSYVKKVILGGETLYAKHLNVWKSAFPNAVFINLYGPTEVTVDCTYYIIDRDYEDGTVIPIGRACRNMEILLLDEDMKPVKKGEAGEICVRGSGLARGYFGDPEKTKAAFVQNPLCSSYPDVIYRTGDIGFENEDGLIVFLERGDNQIKHMGYRIELGEVERAINALNGVDSAVCFFDREMDKIVCAYCGGTEQKDIAAELKKYLPRYMFPNIYIRLQKMPYNANGKIDRVAIKKGYENDDYGV